MSMLLSLWTKFRQWVSVDWSNVTFAIVVGILGVVALMLLMSFLKGNYNKGKAIKWGNVVLLVVVLGILALLCFVRFVD